jgi:hypothetical protein
MDPGDPAEPAGRRMMRRTREWRISLGRTCLARPGRMEEGRMKK